MSSSKGFTLIELMVAVAILAILGAMALPGFRNLIGDHRVTTQVNDFIATLKFARDEAIRRDVTVSLTGNGATVAVASFEDGWCVSTGDGACAAATTIQVGALAQGAAITANAGQFIFGRLGDMTAPADGATLTVFPVPCDAGEWRGREIIVTPTGRASAGSQVVCP